MKMHLYDDCLFHIFTFVDPLELLKSCMIVSEQWYGNVRRVDLNLDFSANLVMNGYSLELSEGRNKAQNTSLIRFDIEELLSCQYMERLHSLNLSFNNIGRAGAKLISQSKYLGNLRELLLQGCMITSEGFGYLLSNPNIFNLTVLDLSRNGLGNADVDRLVENSSKFENLICLQFSGNHVTMGGFVSLLSGSFKNWKELKMEFNRIDDEEYSISLDLIPEIELEVLDLSNTHILHHHLSALCNKLRKLKKLSLKHFSFEPNFKEEILDKLPDLHYLDISNTNPSTILPSLHSCQNLKTLIMNRCLRLKKFDELSNESFLSGLEKLSLVDNSMLKDNAIITIKEMALKRGIDVELDASVSLSSPSNQKKLLKRMAELKITTLCSTLIDNNMMDVFNLFDTIVVSESKLSTLKKVQSIDSSLAYLRNVKSIDMYGCDIGDHGFRLLLTNNVMHNLRELSLGYNGIKEIPSEKDCHPNLKSLTNLDLKYNLIGDEGVSQITTNSYLSNLKILELEINGITIEGLKHIVSSPYMSNLMSLDLDAGGSGDSKSYGILPNRIGDEGFEILMNSNLHNLTYLCVSDNGLGNESAKVIANHTGVKNLVEIVMFENAMTDEAIPYLTSSAIFKFHTFRILYNELTPEGVDQICNSPPFENLCYSI